MHRALRAAGTEADLHVWEAAGHGLFLGMTPEDVDREAEIQRFREGPSVKPRAGQFSLAQVTRENLQGRQDLSTTSMMLRFAL